MSDREAVRVTRLSGGIQVVTHAMPHLETVSLGIWVDAGARHESPHENGIAHFLEHMAFKGTARRSALQIAEEIESVGGDLNAATGMETTAYYARVLKADIGCAMDVLADILQNPRFDPGEVERERGVILQEIAAVQDTPDDLVFDLFHDAAYPDQPLGRAILGTIESVGRFSGRDLAGYRDLHYAPEGMVLAAAGAVDHDRLVDLAAAQFQARRVAGRPVPAPGRFEGGERRIDRDLEQASLVLGFPGLAYVDEDYYGVQVLASILGGGMSSRLFQEVREKRGLCYSIFAFAWGYQDSGVVGVYAGTGPEDLGELVPVIAGELERLSRDVTPEEVARARAQLKAGLLIGLESSSSRAEQIARQQLIHGRVFPVAELAAKVDAVDAAKVRSLAGRLFSGARPAIAAIGPLHRLASYSDIAAEFASRSANPT